MVHNFYRLTEGKDKNNCSKPQPGLASATKIEYYKGDRLSCENIMKRVIKDSHNTIYIPKHEPEKMINVEKKIIYKKAHDCKKYKILSYKAGKKRK